MPIFHLFENSRAQVFLSRHQNKSVLVPHHNSAKQQQADLQDNFWLFQLNPAEFLEEEAVNEF